MPIFTTITAISGSFPDIARNLFAGEDYLYKSAFFPSWQADLTASASFEPIRGGRPQPGSGFILMMKKGTTFGLEPLFTTKPDPKRLASAASSTCE
jgi:hypothetical protein